MKVLILEAISVSVYIFNGMQSFKEGLKRWHYLHPTFWSVRDRRLFTLVCAIIKIQEWVKVCIFGHCSKENRFQLFIFKRILGTFHNLSSKFVTKLNSWVTLQIMPWIAAENSTLYNFLYCCKYRTCLN